jgi:catechol 2,3-dioxygenase-like lactoylglutathione lyase family enzyme
MTPQALWLPYQVADVDAAERFYTVHLGLSRVDSWDSDGDRGVVLRAADRAFVELAGPAEPHPAPLAFELASREAVDKSYARRRPDGLVAAPHHYARGHYGFEMRGPAGAHVMVWSEK